MKQKILSILACPYDKERRLRFEVFDKKAAEVVAGVFTCPRCQRVYPVIEGIPYLLPDDLMEGKKEADRFFARYQQCRPKQSGKKRQKKKTTWREGERVWHPDLISQLATYFKMKQPSSLLANYFASAHFSLDVGCGEHPKGDVNLDIYLPAEVPENFILASAEYLPFREGVFDLVFSSYVIEHCLHPAQFLLDQLRCSSRRVVVVGDNCEWFGDAWCRLSGNGRIFHDEHCYAWTVEYLANLIRRLGYQGKVWADNLSPTYITILTSKLGKLPRIGRFFYRDLIAEIKK